MKRKIIKILHYPFRLLSILIAPFFRDPILTTVSVISCILIYHSIREYADLLIKKDEITSIKVFFQKLDAYKVIGEFIIAIVAYLFYLKSVYISFRANQAFKNLISSEVTKVKNKLLEIKVNKDFEQTTIEYYADALFPIWAKDEHFDNIEFQFIRLIVEFSLRNFSKGKQLFAFYFLLDIYPFSKGKFLIYIAAMPLKTNNPKHEFLSLLQVAKNKLGSGKFDLNQEFRVIALHEAKKIQTELVTGNIIFYEESLQQKFSHEALLTVAEQLIKKGHTDISSLLRYRKRNNPIKMLIKYGENFYYWEQEQKALIKRMIPEAKQEAAQLKLGNLLHPQPFSKALFDFDKELVQLLPKDQFLFIFDIEFINKKHRIKTPLGFMQKKVIPAAKKYHTEMIKEVRKIDSSMIEVRKAFVSNYYIIDMDIESVLIEADAKSTPEGLRRILVREVAKSGNFASMLANNNLYVKEVIETLPSYSILSIMGSEAKTIDFFRNYDKKIRSKLKLKSVSIKNIYESKKISNKHNKLAKDLLDIIKNSDYRGPKISQIDMQTALKNLSEGAAKLEHLVQKGFGKEQ